MHACTIVQYAGLLACEKLLNDLRVRETMPLLMTNTSYEVKRRPEKINPGLS